MCYESIKWLRWYGIIWYRNIQKSWIKPPAAIMPHFLAANLAAFKSCLSQYQDVPSMAAVQFLQVFGGFSILARQRHAAAIVRHADTGV